MRSTVIRQLQTSGVISPTSFVVFLLRNVVQSTSNLPTFPNQCCILGFHSAVGSPVQTYATVDWDTTSAFSGVTGSSVASHEIAEWMDDPLVSFSVFFNTPTDPSLGPHTGPFFPVSSAGGMFSSNGTLPGPANTCLPGGVTPFQFGAGPVPAPIPLPFQ